MPKTRKLDQYVQQVTRGLPTDPLAAVHALDDEIEAIREVMNDLGRLRRDAILEMRKTRSAIQIAADLGISRARVYKLIEGD